MLCVPSADPLLAYCKMYTLRNLLVVSYPYFISIFFFFFLKYPFYPHNHFFKYEVISLSLHYNTSTIITPIYYTTITLHHSTHHYLIYFKLIHRQQRTAERSLLHYPPHPTSSTPPLATYSRHSKGHFITLSRTKNKI